MFDFIGNTIRNIVNDIEWDVTDRSLRRAEKEFDEWDKEYQERSSRINALDAGSQEARKWIYDNRDLPPSVEKMVDNAGLLAGAGYRKAYAGMRASLAAFRSIMLNDEEGFITWSKDTRIVETSIRFFFGKKRYDNYDDIKDSEVPPLAALTSFDNKYDAWVCNEMLEEAFRRVQGSNPMFKLEVDIAKNVFLIKPVKDID